MQLNERPSVPSPAIVPPEVVAQLQSLREEARMLQEERVKLHAELARLQQAFKDMKARPDVGSATAAAMASARQQWDLERQQLQLR